MFESLFEEGRALLDEHRPSANDSKESRGKSFEKMFKALQENIQACFPEGRTMPLVCPVSGVDRDSDDWCRPAFERSFPGSQYKEPLILHISGTECFGFSSMGKQEKTAATNFETFLCWVCVMLRNRPHIIVHEVTELQPESILEFFFEREYPCECVNIQ